ncbi:MAG: hypothetical protein DRG76_01240 [Deltaproteobacteria bacterium]|nr:MAG: hypothetical protein DRG76_01240 [Deltaproteobacteria bacterium]
MLFSFYFRFLLGIDSKGKLILFKNIVFPHECKLLSSCNGDMNYAINSRYSTRADSIWVAVIQISKSEVKWL